MQKSPQLKAKQHLFLLCSGVRQWLAAVLCTTLISGTDLGHLHVAAFPYSMSTTVPECRDVFVLFFFLKIHHKCCHCHKTCPAASSPALPPTLSALFHPNFQSILLYFLVAFTPACVCVVLSYLYVCDFKKLHSIKFVIKTIVSIPFSSV